MCIYMYIVCSLGVVVTRVCSFGEDPDFPGGWLEPNFSGCTLSSGDPQVFVIFSLHYIIIDGTDEVVRANEDFIKSEVCLYTCTCAYMHRRVPSECSQPCNPPGAHWPASPWFFTSKTYGIGGAPHPLESCIHTALCRRGVPLLRLVQVTASPIVAASVRHTTREVSVAGTTPHTHNVYMHMEGALLRGAVYLPPINF